MRKPWGRKLPAAVAVAVVERSGSTEADVFVSGDTVV